MRVFPNFEETERPVNQHRNHRQEKPETRKRFGFFNRAQKRISKQSRKTNRDKSQNICCKRQKADYRKSMNEPESDDRCNCKSCKSDSKHSSNHLPVQTAQSQSKKPKPPLKKQMRPKRKTLAVAVFQQRVAKYSFRLLQT